MLILRRFDCSSRNEPVPAAQALFILKLLIAPFSIFMNFESCPPISMMVSHSGKKYPHETDCAEISSIVRSVFKYLAARTLPEPVVATAAKGAWLGAFAVISATTFSTASSGFPAVGRYALARTFLFLSRRAPFVLTEPTSMPKKSSDRSSESCFTSRFCGISSVFNGSRSLSSIKSKVTEKFFVISESRNFFGVLSEAISAAPIAPISPKCSGILSSVSLSPRISRKAFSTPLFAATPPWKSIGGIGSLPRHKAER